MWSGFEDIAEIIPISNSQNATYWMDKEISVAYNSSGKKKLQTRKIQYKRELFRLVANQAGKLFDENVLTIVWARRFAAYKRANLILRDFHRFINIICNEKFQVQIIWAGKPYPEDHQAISIFNEIYNKTKDLKRCAVLTGYELELSGLLKRGSDVWLNTPTIYHEASGTSGMTAAMNGSVNLSIADGWIPEFAQHGKNSFLIEEAKEYTSPEERDQIECKHLLDVLEHEVIPLFYQKPANWNKLQLQAITDVLKNFDSNRMAQEYYQKLYEFESTRTKKKVGRSKGAVSVKQLN
jgi:starch phosphorylase